MTPEVSSNEELEAQVRDYIALMADVSADRVQPATRLLQDLGIDGDDAVELFGGLHERFGTDLTPLYEHWDQHFGPEGVGWPSILIIAPGAAVGGIVGSSVDPAAGIAVAVLLVTISLWVAPKLGLGRRLIPVTVADVTRAVKFGSWQQTSSVTQIAQP